MRLQDITLSYDLPHAFARRIAMKTGGVVKGVVRRIKIEGLLFEEFIFVAGKSNDGDAKQTNNDLFHTKYFRSRYLNQLSNFS